MARGPDGVGAGRGSSLADQLFNAESVGQLAAEQSARPGFDADRFLREALAGLETLPLMARLDHIAAVLARQLPQDFPAMADALEAAMPPPLDPDRRDGDFGRFIHAVPGVLAVRFGLDHPDRALDLIHAATQRFSMEFHLRPFLTAHPDRVLDRLAEWAGDPNYHVRRLVSEGTRPNLPWGGKLALDPDRTLPLLDRLHADPARFVTRSVANHLNDLSKTDLDRVLRRLDAWHALGAQDPAELRWITRHALRTAVKRGAPEALRRLGYDPDARLSASLSLENTAPRIGDTLTLKARIGGTGPILVDYRIRFHRPSGRPGEKTFKLGTTTAPARLEKRHRILGQATTFTWHPGPHRIIMMVNGRDRAEAEFDLRP